MARGLQSKMKAGGFAAALLACAGLAVAVPGVASNVAPQSRDAGLSSLQLFTPASVDPALAQRVAQDLAKRGDRMRFTPASGSAASDRTVTVAVRVDDQTARAIGVRSAIAQARGTTGTRAATSLPVAATRYDLGIARGYTSFAKPATKLPSGVRQVAMPDLAQFEPQRGSAADKPSRFQPRISLEEERNVGRAEGTLRGDANQSVDLGGSYRVTRNLDVTAGVRVSQERDRLAPLTDGVQDEQAVYVGTQFRF